MSFRLVDCLLNFPNFVVSRVQIWAVRNQRCGKMNADVSRFGRFIVKAVTENG